VFNQRIVLLGYVSIILYSFSFYFNDDFLLVVMKTNEFNLTDIHVLNNIDYLQRLITHRKHFGFTYHDLTIELNRQKLYLK
jgi:hypothetical protein